MQYSLQKGIYTNWEFDTLSKYDTIQKLTNNYKQFSWLGDPT